jgi:predicted phage terminase large subunit-like protein
LEEIDAELSRRERQPNSPAQLAEIVSQGRWKSARHLELLNRKLIELSERKIKRLIVTMPPRHGKSQLCSRYYPAQYLGKNPDHRVILCSYEANFAAEWGGRARDILTEHGRELFGVRVRDDRSARDDWSIEGREGGMVTAGVGGPITGRGANLLIIDDPVKNSAEANSETYRDRTWEWWLSTALTRLEPDGVVLLVMTRWHEDDLAGRLIKQNTTRQNEDEEADDENWEILNLPAIAEEDDQLGREPGEALWIDRWPIKKLLRRMKRLGTYVWNALFQQRPSPPEGNYFKREWFKIVPHDRVPTADRIVRCWDLAATAEDEAANPDWLVGTKMIKAENGNYYILHINRSRISPKNVEENIKQTAAIDGRHAMIRIEQEGAASGKLTKYHFVSMLDGYDAKFTPIPKSSKLTRSGPFNAACERGEVLLVEGEWNEQWLDEVSKFPYGSHDDDVDSAVGAYEALATAITLETNDAQPEVIY